MMDIDQDSAQVRIPPPLILLFFVLVGVAADFLYPLPFLPNEWRPILGALFFCAGFLTVVYCKLTFQKAKTEIKPWKTTSTIITTGIYGYSRNPIYISFVVAGFGVACAVNSLWIIVFLFPFMAAVYKLAIEKEEKYLEQKFGEEYRAYKAKVRRWL